MNDERFQTLMKAIQNGLSVPKRGEKPHEKVFMVFKSLYEQFGNSEKITHEAKKECYQGMFPLTRDTSHEGYREWLTLEYTDDGFGLFYSITKGNAQPDENFARVFQFRPILSCVYERSHKTIDSDEELHLNFFMPQRTAKSEELSLIVSELSFCTLMLNECLRVFKPKIEVRIL